ncbi:MAG: hypothetical protein ALECFALPRED_000119 [Alectoria fallacina]|uniref:mRNA N(6)-methyladenine demethylase n=1 Tax=Alectoria fallacina TaxID=1903189 RepID=A0A8H3I4K9_9LECA|nr:MAG: hypothetical protein ALECFALPRED_000119 [Alectoria fallacina]
MINSLDARDKPPEFIKSIYKKYQKLTLEVIQSDPMILDFRRASNCASQCRVRKIDSVPQSLILAAYSHLGLAENDKGMQLSLHTSVYETEAVPGLFVIPSLISEDAQKILLSKLLHRDLADQRHKTNVHLHHLLPYHAAERSLLTTIYNSFFNMSPESPELFLPIDEAIHKHLTVSQFLERKLRWLTLGGQYNWTAKTYPAEKAPSFPEDIANFIHVMFPYMKPEAAILNIYTPGDTLSVHRDVSEESNNELISMSFGCDGIFIIGLDSEKREEPTCVVVRLHSGDAVVMSGPARFAWHGVPRVIRNTCPGPLRDWPAIADNDSTTPVREEPYEAWRGWMSNKRINLNVRQMKD